MWDGSVSLLMMFTWIAWLRWCLSGLSTIVTLCPFIMNKCHQEKYFETVQISCYFSNSHHWFYHPAMLLPCISYYND